MSKFKKFILVIKVIIDWLAPLNFARLVRDIKDIKNK